MGNFFEDTMTGLLQAISIEKRKYGGNMEKLASIESYANDRAMDKVIITCFDFNKSTEETVSYVEKNFPEVDGEKIISRVTFLWNQRKEK